MSISLNLKLRTIGEYIFKEGKTKPFAESFVKNVFPYLKKSPKEYPYTIEEKPVRELEAFWQDIEKIADHKLFSDQEKDVLTKQPVAAELLLGSTLGAATKANSFSTENPGPAQDLASILQALKKSDLDHETLEKLRYSQRFLAKDQKLPVDLDDIKDAEEKLRTLKTLEKILIKNPRLKDYAKKCGVYYDQ